MSVAVGMSSIPDEATIVMRIMKNGVEDIRLFHNTKGASATKFAMLQGSTIIFVNALDIIHIEVYCSLAGASTVVGTNQSYWKAIRLGSNLSF